MRTFEELQEIIKANKISTLQRAKQALDKGDLEYFEKQTTNKIIQNCQSNIENIEEVTTIEIGAETNSLIKAIQDAYKIHLEEYWQDFERFAEEYVTGLTPDGKRKDGAYFGQSQCLELGIGIDELSCFKGHDPMKGETGDLFKQVINTNYGTNIPMNGVEQQALEDYRTVAFGDDKTTKAQAFIHLREIQRDSGSLRNGVIYYTLATDKKYQEAKAICSEKKL